MFRVDDPRSEPRVLHELTQNKMAEDAENDIAIRFVDENDYREISAKAVSSNRKLKKNRPSSFVLIIIRIIIVYSTFLQHKLNYKAGH